MNKLNLIKHPVSDELFQFESYFRSRVKTNVPFLNIAINYIIRTKGKQVRPLLTFLTAKLFGYVTKKTFEAATMIELLHTATLVHDDIVDESFERRGRFSVNALWKSKKAVLIGDYILSKGMLTALEFKNYELLHTISEAVAQMSEGELLQAQTARESEINMEHYLEVINKKTATLFAACTKCGAQSVISDPVAIENMKQLGENLGMAFQIKDDLFDYQGSSLIGKPRGNDFKDMKFTLPIIYSMQSVNISNKSAFIKYLNKQYKFVDNENIISFITQTGGFEKTIQTMNDFKLKAITCLEQVSDSEAKKSLIDLIDYVIERKN